MKVKLLKRAKKLRAFADATNFGEKLYFLGFLLLLWAGVLWFFTEKYSSITALFGLLTFTGGLVCEAIYLVNRLWENKYAKVLLSLVAATGSTATIAVSAFIVANIVGADPSNFPYTTAIVSFLLVPLNTWLILLAIAVLSMILFVAALPLMWAYQQTLSSPVFRYTFRLKQKPRKERYFWLMVVVRSVAIGFLFSTVQLWGRFDLVYSNFVVNKASAFLYNLELYPNSYCERKNNTERIGYISNDLAVVGSIDSKGNYNFETRECNEAEN